jgi:hypothetical protein
MTYTERKSKGTARRIKNPFLNGLGIISAVGLGLYCTPWVQVPHPLFPEGFFRDQRLAAVAVPICGLATGVVGFYVLYLIDCLVRKNPVEGEKTLSE